MSKKRDTTSEAQWEMCVILMEEDPRLATNQFGNNTEKQIAWGNMVDKLNNSFGGAQASVASWKERLRAWKNRLRKSEEMAKALQGGRLEGSKAANYKPLNMVEKRALYLFNGSHNRSRRTTSNTIEKEKFYDSNLINAVQRHPELYSKYTTDYGRHKCWQNIAKELEGNEWDLKKRWTTLEVKFFQQIKSPKLVIMSQWYMTKMNFLLDLAVLPPSTPTTELGETSTSKPANNKHCPTCTCSGGGANNLSLLDEFASLASDLEKIQIKCMKVVNDNFE